MMSDVDLQGAVDALKNCIPDFKEITVRGARTVFRKAVYRAETYVDLENLELFPSSSISTKVVDTLREWAKDKEYITLGSEHLPTHLNLPVQTYPPPCTLFQVLLLGKDLHFVLLTVYERQQLDSNREDNGREEASGVETSNNEKEIRGITLRGSQGPIVSPKEEATNSVECLGETNIHDGVKIKTENEDREGPKYPKRAHRDVVNIKERRYTPDFSDITNNAEVNAHLNGDEKHKDETEHKEQDKDNDEKEPKDHDKEKDEQELKDKEIIKKDKENYRLGKEQEVNKDKNNGKYSKDQFQHLAEEFTMRCARRLTSALMNFCRKEFILLPCTLELGSLNAHSLDAEVNRQLDKVREFCLSPERLRSSSFEELKIGLPLVASTIDVPSGIGLLPDESPIKRKDSILQPDSSWDKCLRLLISRLASHTPSPSRTLTLKYRSEQEHVKMVVVEAAKRLSYSRRVVIVSDDSKVKRCVEKLANTSASNFGLDASWFTCESVQDFRRRMDASRQTNTTMESAGLGDNCIMIIAIDAPEVHCCPGLSLKVMQYHTGFHTDHLRVLLVGRSGSGISSTGNSLLGRQAFTFSVSLSSVTQIAQTCTRTYGSVSIQVTDTPGIFNLKGLFNNQCSPHPPYPESSTDVESFHIICYIIKIGRFTEEEQQVFERIKFLMTGKMLENMVIIFTHGDDIEDCNMDDIMQDAPESLNQILDLCGRRYVVFDNMSPDHGDQINDFLAVVNRMDIKEKYVCPDYNELLDRWDHAQRLDFDRRKRKLGAAG